VVLSTVLTDRLRMHRDAPSSAGGMRWAGYPGWVRRPLELVRALSPEGRDALLYAGSALFAGVTAFAVGIPLYRQWGQMAVGPYAPAAVLMAVVARRVAATARADGGTGPEADPGGSGPGRGQGAVPRPITGSRSWRAARVAAFLIALFGATVVPLAMEVIWRSEGNAALHVQPEVLVVEQAGARAAHGKDPYRVVDRNGHILIHEHTEPIYELYYPYLPGMVVFGFSTGSKVEARLTDARIQFLIFTGLVTLFALSRLRPPTDARVRALQVLTVLPTAALPLATGGDDMPVVALMLLGLVALRRRRPLLAGLALGAASSLKFTAWPLALLALWAASDARHRRAAGRYALGVLVVMAPVVLPVALSNPSAFVDNVIRFPLGLAGVSSPAASALPGHILVAALPGIHRVYVGAIIVLGGAALVWRLRRRPPRNAAEVAGLAGWVMLIAILLAPATRVGYLLYPINLFVWAWMLAQAEDPFAPPSSGAAQLSSGSSHSSSETEVVPADVVGETVAPTSQ
jgi:MYXO-CTERM domain-containing protein